MAPGSSPDIKRDCTPVAERSPNRAPTIPVKTVFKRFKKKELRSLSLIDTHGTTIKLGNLHMGKIEPKY